MTAARDDMLKFWDAETGRELLTLILFNNGEIMRFTPEKYYYSAKSTASKLPGSRKISSILSNNSTSNTIARILFCLSWVMPIRPG